MPAGSEWSLSATESPEKIVFDGPVTELTVSVVNGTVNVVGTDGGPARLELTALDGPPLKVVLRGGELTVGYEDLRKGSFFSRLSRKTWNRSADVTLAVPASADVRVSAVGASTVVSGIAGRTKVTGVSGDTTLVGLTGDVCTETVSGRVEAQRLTGDVRCNGVSGDLTLVECSGGRIKADSVSGTTVIDLAPAAPVVDLAVTSVSGEVAVRLPSSADATVDAGTTVGPVSCSFPELRIRDQFGARNISGRLGEGRGTIKVTSVSGAVALLHGPDADDWADGDDAAPGAPAGARDQGKVL